MFLAAAECYAPRVLAWGLVEFHGVDLDPLCARMARVNLALYGLRGRVICADALAAESVDRLPDPWRPAWATAYPGLLQAAWDPPMRIADCGLRNGATADARQTDAETA